jgi:hypothetical protein
MGGGFGELGGGVMEGFLDLYLEGELQVGGEL